VSTGAIHRRIAAALGQSALETNLVAEQDASIDQLIDGELVRLGSTPAPLVFDSRMAWHFVPDAVRIHLLVDPDVGAARMLGRGSTAVEGYEDVAHARAQAEERHASEQRRFLATYGVDIDRLRNYDVVVDTTVAGIEQVTDVIADAVAAPGALPAAPHLLFAPRRLVAAAHVVVAGVPADDGLRLAWLRPHATVLGGRAVVRAADERGDGLVPAVLVAEGAEELPDGRTPADLAGEVAGGHATGETTGG
jgi:cytidylate kinase